MKKQQLPREINVKVIRAFRMGGEEIPKDSVVTLEYRFAMEMINAGKAVQTAESPRAPANKSK